MPHFGEEKGEVLAFWGKLWYPKLMYIKGGIAVSIHESGEMYLEAILVLNQKNGFTRSVDVGEYLGYSKPSVSRAMSILRSGGYVQVEDNGGLVLTNSGREIAEKIFERHTLLSQLLMALGVPEGTAIADACKMEHAISDESFQALKRHMEQMKQSQ